MLVGVSHSKALGRMTTIRHGSWQHVGQNFLAQGVMQVELRRLNNIFKCIDIITFGITILPLLEWAGHVKTWGDRRLSR